MSEALPDGAAAGPGRRGTLAARATDLGFAAGWSAVRWLPEPLARGAFDLAGDWLGRGRGTGVRQLQANLRVITGGRLPADELDRLTRTAMRSYARYWQETFRLPVLGVERILRGTEVVGGEHLDRVLAAGRPLVAALPHSGNWDASSMWFLDRLGGPFMTVAERLQPESLYDRFVAVRESLGMRVVPLTGGPRPSATVLREWLDAGRSVCLLCDRDLGGNGVGVTFAGRATTMPGGPALLAAQTGAALLPIVCSFTERGWRMTWHPEVPLAGPGRLRDRVHAATQGVADAFARTIAEHPQDWHVLGRIWPDVPPDPAGQARR